MAAQVNRSISSPLIRQIAAADFDLVAELLAKGFDRDREHWRRCLQRLAKCPAAPPGFPRYGYLLVCNGVPVGVIVLIFASVLINGERKVKCNVCSWYVEPEFRSYASILASHALRHKSVIYVNVAPAPHTLPILNAHGYVKYSRGWFAAVPALSAKPSGVRVRAMAAAELPPENVQPFENELLLSHAEYGCINLICNAADGPHPFIFMRRSFKRLPFAYLVYCREISEFVRFAGPLGRTLARRGIPLVFVDANGPIPGLIGRYFDDYPKFYKGPDRPRLGDLTYSELVMFRLEGDRVSHKPRRSLKLSRLLNGRRGLQLDSSPVRSIGGENSRAS